MNLTNRNIKAMVSKTTRYIVWDDFKGFGVCIHPTGHKVFVLKYRNSQNRQVMYTIGRWGALTADQAREQAKKLVAERLDGVDPQARKKEGRAGRTVKEAAKRFDEEHISHRKPATQGQYRAILNQDILPALGKMRVDAVTENDIRALIFKIRRTHPVKSNRVRAVLSKLFALAERWGMRKQGTNPVTHVEKCKEKERHRDLKDDELAAFAAALESAEGETNNVDAVDAIRLLLFTGCRRGEVLNLKRTEVDLERGLLRLADSKTDAKAVFLNVAAIEVLKRVEERRAEEQRRDEQKRQAEAKARGEAEVIEMQPHLWVFPQLYRPEGREQRPMPEWELREVWESVRKKAGLDGDKNTKPFRIHDLRHTYASLGAAEGLSLPQIGALLGHTQSRTTERYADLVNGPNKAAAEIIGQRLLSAMSVKPKEQAEVVPIKQ